MDTQPPFLPNTADSLNSLPEGSVISYGLSELDRWEKRAAGWQAFGNPTMDYPWPPELLLSYYEVEQGWEDFAVEHQPQG